MTILNIDGFSTIESKSAISRDYESVITGENIQVYNTKEAFELATFADEFINLHKDFFEELARR
ncbi:MAG: hypothetical protein ACYSRP_07300 [Planctomycetota bacterium]|jgi:hypothetical protein